MGCGHSKPETQHTSEWTGDRTAQLTSRPAGPPRTATPEPDSYPYGDTDYDSEIDIDINRKDLQSALRHVADYLHQHGSDIVLIAYGGAVSTLYLQSRESTHDIDFFSGGDHHRLVDLLDQASNYARSKSNGEDGLVIGANWLDDGSSRFASEELRIELAKQARDHGAIMFEQRPGLTIYVAPWMYAICGKVNRMGGPENRRRALDGHDAAQFLCKYVELHGGGPVRASLIFEKTREYFSELASPAALHEINLLYRKNNNGANGITF